MFYRASGVSYLFWLNKYIIILKIIFKGKNNTVSLCTVCGTQWDSSHFLFRVIFCIKIHYLMSYSIWLCSKWIIFFCTSQIFHFWNKVCETNGKNVLCTTLPYWKWNCKVEIFRMALFYLFIYIYLFILLFKFLDDS